MGCGCGRVIEGRGRRLSEERSLKNWNFKVFSGGEGVGLFILKLKYLGVVGIN